MGTIWRFVVLLLIGWFLAGLILGHHLPSPIPTDWVATSVVASIALAWLWSAWSANRKKRAQP